MNKKPISWIDEDDRTFTPKSLCDSWINYKELFLMMYGKHIFEHYQDDIESFKILKYEILYM